MKKLIITLMGVMTMTAFSFDLNSSGIKEGYIENKYGKHGTENIQGMPSLSLPLEWKDAPKDAKAYAVVMQDYDAIPVCGFSWIHWVAIIPGEYSGVKENASQEDKNIIQGLNSWHSPLGNLDKGTASHFGGPAPPDKDHTYEIKLYALSEMPKLENGFYLNELYSEIKGNILGESILEGKYKK
ncbi:MAG: YbhB/YbcL family Raf kinase inhibitor-like protein [Fusobacteriaceae bacterium]